MVSDTADHADLAGSGKKGEDLLKRKEIEFLKVCERVNATRLIK
jgi:hypothetical protein